MIRSDRLDNQISVLIPPHNSVSYTDNPKEPQYITAKQPVQGFLYVDSKDAPYGVDRTNCQIGGNNTLASNFNRIRVLGVNVLWYIPNVNPRNNTIVANVDGTDYTAQLASRFYDINVGADITQLATDIAAALTTASGVLFTATAVTGFPRQYTLSVPIGHTFYIDPTCPAVTKGAQMYGFQVEYPNLAPAQTKQLGPMNMMYTQYVDIKSTIVTKWQKIGSTTTGGISPVMMRAYVGGNKWGVDFDSVLDEYLAYSWKGSEPITYLDFQWFDSNGDPLYVPNGGKDFEWQINFTLEL